MPSSTSSSDRPGFRLTASDRAGVAQPVPERDIPARAWKPIFLGALAVFVLAMAGWEAYWRAFGAVPSYSNSDEEWAQQRRRVDGNQMVILGSSRMLFDINLDVWEKTVGERPIQLAIEGTSPIPVLEDLADDPSFTGRVLVGVAPDLFFTGFAYRTSAFEYAKKETPAQRVGNWLSRALVEPYFAFFDKDFALTTVIRRQHWPARPGKHEGTRVRKLMIQPGADRNSEMWDKVVSDPEYRALCRKIWAEDFDEMPPNLNTVELRQKSIDEQIDKAAAAIAKLRARGVRVVFVRAPTIDAYYAFEQRFFPRAISWDKLIEKTGALGIHFEDNPQLQGYDLPEWSHMSAPEARRFTAQLAPLVESALQAAPRP
jgi:hypothetical protein